MKWRLLSLRARVMVDPVSGARGMIRDPCADGAYRFHWSIIPSQEPLPIAAGAPTPKGQTLASLELRPMSGSRAPDEGSTYPPGKESLRCPQAPAPRPKADASGWAGAGLS